MGAAVGLEDFIVEVLDAEAEPRDADLADRFDGPLPLILRVLRKLLDNAIRYTEVGEVRLIARPSKAGDEQTTTVEFMVIDSGPGLDPFDPRSALYPDPNRRGPGDRYPQGIAEQADSRQAVAGTKTDYSSETDHSIRSEAKGCGSPGGPWLSCASAWGRGHRAGRRP